MGKTSVEKVKMYTTRLGNGKRRKRMENRVGLYVLDREKKKRTHAPFCSMSILFKRHRQKEHANMEKLTKNANTAARNTCKCESKGINVFPETS